MFLELMAKKALTYELELLAACLAMDVWARSLLSSCSFHYGGKDNVRLALIRGTGLGTVAGTIMTPHRQTEVDSNTGSCTITFPIASLSWRKV